MRLPLPGTGGCLSSRAARSASFGSRVASAVRVASWLAVAPVIGVTPRLTVAPVVGITPRLTIVPVIVGVAPWCGVGSVIVIPRCGIVSIVVIVIPRCGIVPIVVIVIPWRGIVSIVITVTSRSSSSGIPLRRTR